MRQLPYLHLFARRAHFVDKIRQRHAVDLQFLAQAALFHKRAVVRLAREVPPSRHLAVVLAH